MLRPLFILAATTLSLPIHAELPIPLPVIHRLVAPALTGPKNVAIEGTGFDPRPNTPFEVHLGEQVVEARRESPTRIVIDKSVVAPLFQALGRARDRQYPVWLKVGGEKSNVVKL